MGLKKVFPGKGLETCTDLTGWEGWRRVLPTSDSLVNSERSGGFGFSFLAKSQIPTLKKHSLPSSAVFLFCFVRVCVKAAKPGFYQRA